MKIVVEEILCEEVYWIDLAQDTDNWRGPFENRNEMQRVS